MKTHPFERKVECFIRERALLMPDDRVLVGVSGGSDSVAVLACLIALRSKWNWEISIAHMDHGLRGEESAADMAFVRDLGKAWRLKTTVQSVKIEKRDIHTAKHSLQEYARNIRYQVLNDIASDLGANKIALGHQADDQAETVLMWMLRGAGTGGLGGMSPKRGERIVRPILDRTKAEVLEYLHCKHIPFRTDSTNAQPLYLRNRIRQEFIPLLQKYSPGIIKVMARQAHILRDDHVYLENLARQAFEQCCFVKERKVQVRREALLNLNLPIQRRVMRLCVQQVMDSAHWPRFDMIQRILDQVLSGKAGWVIECQGVHVSQDENRLIVRSGGQDTALSVGEQTCANVILPIPGVMVWPFTGQQIRLSESSRPGNSSPTELFEARFDRETFSSPLTVRSWLDGDVFYPKGLGGKRKKLQDFFTDMKLPRSKRSMVPLLVAPEGIMCVGTLRVDERFEATARTRSLVFAHIYRT
ncbi:MAG: tRNA lysidine(34) synthetase TilS [Nitrospirales bacterium]|nr:tRNA lysidine(34) synthetase TilS [Nitrospirales bacterium]